MEHTNRPQLLQRSIQAAGLKVGSAEHSEARSHLQGLCVRPGLAAGAVFSLG